MATVAKFREGELIRIRADLEYSSKFGGLYAKERAQQAGDICEITKVDKWEDGDIRYYLNGNDDLGWTEEMFEEKPQEEEDDEAWGAFCKRNLVGTKVKIRSDLIYGQTYGDLHAWDSHLKYLGETKIVTDCSTINGSCIFFYLDNDNYVTWTKEMFSDYIVSPDEPAQPQKKKEEPNMAINLDSAIKTGINGDTLVRGRADGYYRINPNGGLSRELSVFDNIASIQRINVQTLALHDIIEKDGDIFYVSGVTDSKVELTSFATLTSTNMAVVQADGLDNGFTKIVNPITFQIEQLQAKPRDILATVASNVPKLQVHSGFQNSDNLAKLTAFMEHMLTPPSPPTTTSQPE